jgi:signal peptidase II
VTSPKPKSLLSFRSPLAIGLCFAATLGLCAADLASKGWAMETLSEPVKTRIAKHPGELLTLCRRPAATGQRCQRPPQVLVEGYLEFEYAENTGAAFGIGRDWPKALRIAVFGIAALAAAIGLLWMFISGKGGPLFAWSVPLVVSGAAGNLVDRARLNFVVDFIRFHVFEKWSYPTFNIADITIVVGVALMLLDGFHKESKAKRAAELAVKREAETKAAEEASEAPKRKKGGKKRAKKAADGASSEPAP